jgi:hypothetical protein
MARARELLAALVAVVAATALYLGYVRATGVPAAGDLVGHLLGVVGFTMMLLTETLYSLRKRAMRRPRGSMRAWLQVHIFMGIVGPYLVLLHSAWTFRGLAGVLTLMTGLVVASGFVGRYIYTAVPRTADGAVVEAQELQRQLAALRAGEGDPAAGQSAPLSAQRAVAAREADRRERAMARRVRQLERQIAALRWQRRVLATWHAIHVPMGMAMFVVAFTHVAATIYYATLLR